MKWFLMIWFAWVRPLATLNLKVEELQAATTTDQAMFLGIFEEDFIEERRSGLEGFVNKVAGHYSW